MFNKGMAGIPDPAMPSPYLVEAEKMMRAQAEAAQREQAALLRGLGQGPYPPTQPGEQRQRYRTTTITIQETSNGQIVKVGQIMRLCGRDDHLIDVIAATLAEHEIDSNT